MILSTCALGGLSTDAAPRGETALIRTDHRPDRCPRLLVGFAPLPHVRRVDGRFLRSNRQSNWRHCAPVGLSAGGRSLQSGRTSAPSCRIWCRPPGPKAHGVVRPATGVDDRARAAPTSSVSAAPADFVL